jgi:hypothetical protein
MAGTIHARLAHGVLHPRERLDVPEGGVLTITVLRLPVNEAGGGLERSTARWTGVDDAEALKRPLNADRMRSTRPERRYRPPASSGAKAASSCCRISGTWLWPSAAAAMV